VRTATGRLGVLPRSAEYWRGMFSCRRSAAASSSRRAWDTIRETKKFGASTPIIGFSVTVRAVAPAPTVVCRPDPPKPVPRRRSASALVACISW
jgi:hypothetical protein